MKIIYCPVNGWNCPYYDKGRCGIYPNTDPIDKCDDFALFWEKGEDYIVNLEVENLED